ncbi:lipid transferase CIDEA-like isoform X2 [Paramormyrops kingsleyae]|uniref:lipid transferase CIDEA-like isoform X2 n=1 Tax=Paramormyrops kingsleyae TaxID=1676925 RepID=UPI000CD647AC|nr:cell death activator CIDE-A-like isoform X2 [Paramormyrops kingsleyae]
MEYAKALVPHFVARRMSLVSMFLTHGLSLLPPRPFRVCTYDRAQRRAVTATSLDDLVHKFLTLTLEEDGSVIDTEDFFQSLPNDAEIMVLEKGQTWSHIKDMSVKTLKRNGIAKVTFDLYKLHPKDVIGCLNIKARLYDAYTISYDIRCTKAKHLFVCALCFLARMAAGVAHLLLCGSSSVLQYFEHD